MILNIANLHEILISDKAAGFKYFIGYKNDDIGRPLCIILLQISGHRKYFENGGKNMSFIIKDDRIGLTYDEIWNKINKTLNTKFHSMPVYDEKYIKLREENLIM